MQKNKTNNIVKEPKVSATISVYVEKDNSSRKVKVTFNKTTIKDILNELHILSSVAIVTINDEIVTDDEIIQEKDNIKILSVISGG